MGRCSKVVTDILAAIAKEIRDISGTIDEAMLKNTVEIIVKAPRVFTAGAGRAGAMMQCLTKRLMHIGIEAYVVGETTTPPARRGDLFLIGSGSGETESLVVLAGKAKKLGVSVHLITTNGSSTIGKMADSLLIIPASTPKSAVSGGGVATVQPMANLFEQMLLICGDALSIEVAKQKGMDYDSMFARHANLE